MSWSLSVPKQEDVESFCVALWKAKETPKADGRTTAGKKQKRHVVVAKDAMNEMAYAAGATAGSASGHVAPDLSGYVSVTVNVPAP